MYCSWLVYLDWGEMFWGYLSLEVGRLVSFVLCICEFGVKRREEFEAF
jgi:hypothetical protein